MEQLYDAFVEAVLDPVEKRYGKLTATLLALVLVAVPIAGAVVALWLITGR